MHLDLPSWIHRGDVRRRLYRSAAALLCVVGATLVAACHHSTLGTPAFVGASATAGVGAATSAEPEGELPVDLAVAYDAVVVVGHDEPERHGDGLFYQRPAEAAREQALALADNDASVVFAIDWLFWAAYGPVGEHEAGAMATALREGPMPDIAGRTGPGEDDAALAERLRRVDAALAELDAIAGVRDKPTPVVLGDLPDFAGDPGTSNRPVSRLSPADIVAMNEHIAAWAAARPWVVVLPVSSFASGPRTLPDGTPLIQHDGLHPTAAGLVFMVQQSMEELERRGMVRPGDWERDPTVAMSRLPDAARAALDTPSAGWLDKAGMYLAYRSLQDQLEAQPVDCTAVVKSVSRLFDPAPTLDEDPSGTGFGTIVAILAALTAVGECPDAVVPLRRCADRLGLDVRRPRPNAFRFELWSELSWMLGRQQEVDERITRLCREVGGDWDAHAEVIDDRCDRLRFVSGGDPGKVAASRARVVALVGGVDATVARGRWILDSARGQAAAATDAPAATDGMRERPVPLAEVPFPPAKDERLAVDERSHRAQRALELVFDLRGAAATGVEGASAAAATLLETIKARIGDDGIGVAVDRRRRLAECPLAPNGGVVVRGYVDPAQRLQWGPFLDDEPLSLSIEGVIQPSNAPDAPRSISPMQQLIDRRPAIALGLVGRFGAPDGDFTFVDGTSVSTRVNESATPDIVSALISRAVAPTDVRDVSMRPLATEWAERPLGDATDLPALWAATWREAQLAGVDTAFPFGVRLDGSFESITVRVERGAESPPSSRDATSSWAMIFGAALPTARPPAIVEVDAVDATIVGVVAPWSVCHVVRPNTPMHLHATWRDADGTQHTGELVGLRGGRRLTLRVPTTDR